MDELREEQDCILGDVKSSGSSSQQASLSMLQLLGVPALVQKQLLTLCVSGTNACQQNFTFKISCHDHRVLS